MEYKDAISISHLNAHQNNDAYEDKLEKDGCLQGITQISNVTSRFASNSSGLNNLKSYEVFPKSILVDPFSRLLLGSTFFLVTCLALILGVEYPLWICPAAVVTFLLATGNPPDSAQSIVRVRDSCRGMARQPGHNHSNPLFSVSWPLPMVEPVAVFGHLFCFHTDIVLNAVEKKLLKRPENQIDIGSGLSHTVMSETASILFQVYSVGWFGRMVLEGVGYLDIPTKAGSGDEEISCWKPVGTIWDRICEYYVGNSVKLKDNSFARVKDKSSIVLNRVGVVSENSGRIRFRYRVVSVDPTKGAMVTEEAELQSQLPQPTLGQTVNEILSSFRAAGMNLSTTSNAYTSLAEPKDVRALAKSILEEPGRENSVGFLDDTSSVASSVVSAVARRKQTNQRTKKPSVAKASHMEVAKRARERVAARRLAQKAEDEKRDISALSRSQGLATPLSASRDMSAFVTRAEVIAQTKERAEMQPLRQSISSTSSSLTAVNRAKPRASLGAPKDDLTTRSSVNFRFVEDEVDISSIPNANDSITEVELTDLRDQTRILRDDGPLTNLNISRISEGEEEEEKERERGKDAQEDPIARMDPKNAVTNPMIGSGQPPVKEEMTKQQTMENPADQKKLVQTPDPLQNTTQRPDSKKLAALEIPRLDLSFRAGAKSDSKNDSKDSTPHKKDDKDEEDDDDKDSKAAQRKIKESKADEETHAVSALESDRKTKAPKSVADDKNTSVQGNVVDTIKGVDDKDAKGDGKQKLVTIQKIGSKAPPKTTAVVKADKPSETKKDAEAARHDSAMNFQIDFEDDEVDGQRLDSEQGALDGRVTDDVGSPLKSSKPNKPNDKGLGSAGNTTKEKSKVVSPVKPLTSMMKGVSTLLRRGNARQDVDDGKGKASPGNSDLMSGVNDKTKQIVKGATKNKSNDPFEIDDSIGKGNSELNIEIEDDDHEEMNLRSEPTQIKSSKITAQSPSMTKAAASPARGLRGFFGSMTGKNRKDEKASTPSLESLMDGSEQESAITQIAVSKGKGGGTSLQPTAQGLVKGRGKVEKAGTQDAGAVPARATAAARSTPQVRGPQAPMAGGAGARRRADEESGANALRDLLGDGNLE